MTLVLHDLRDDVEAAAGGTVDPRLNVDKIVNEAGNYLYDMHPWEWRMGASVSLDFVANQNWIELPRDFAEIVGIDVTSSVVKDVRQTDIETILELRSDTADVVFDYWVAPEHPDQHSRSEPPAHTRLAVYPTPTSASASAITLIYRRQWVELQNGEDVPNVPPRWYLLLRQLIRATARGYSLTVPGDVFEHLEPIEQSALLMNLKEAGGREHSDLGMLQGGVVRRDEEPIYRPYSTIART